MNTKLVCILKPLLVKGPWCDFKEQLLCIGIVGHRHTVHKRIVFIEQLLCIGIVGHRHTVHKRIVL